MCQEWGLLHYAKRSFLLGKKTLNLLPLIIFTEHLWLSQKPSPYPNPISIF